MPFVNTNYEGFTVITTQFEEVEIVLSEDEATFYMYASGEVDWNVLPMDEYNDRNVEMLDLRIYDLIVYNEDNEKILDYNHTDNPKVTHGFVNSAQSWLEENLPVDWEQIDDIMEDLKAEADGENKNFRRGYYELGDPDE